MAERSNRSRRERLRYGICLNEECEKCKTKEIQAIPLRKEFICPTCGQELRECPPPKKSKMGLWIGVAVAIIALIVLAFLLFGGGEQKDAPKGIDSTATKVDTAKAVTTPRSNNTDSSSIKSDTVIKSSDNTNTRVEGSKTIEQHVTSTVTTITTKSSSSKTKSGKVSGGSGQSKLKLSYGTYIGEVKGGYPNGMGRLTYSQDRQINRFDTKGRKASAGDYVIGEFKNGFLVHGKHFNSNNELVESIIVGVADDNLYESK